MTRTWDSLDSTRDSITSTMPEPRPPAQTGTADVYLITRRCRLLVDCAVTRGVQLDQVSATGAHSG